VCAWQEISLSSSAADGLSRHSEPCSVVFATPKARLFHSLKYGNKAASPAQLSVSGRDRMTASMRYNQALVVETRRADMDVSYGFNMLSPQSHETMSFDTDTVDCTDISVAETNDRLPQVTENLFTSHEDEACVDQVSCYYRSPTLQRQQFHLVFGCITCCVYFKQLN